MPASIRHLQSIVPWRMRQLTKKCWSRTKDVWWKAANAVGVAPVSDTDRVRRWRIPPLSICERKEQAFRSLFSLKEYESDLIQQIRCSLQDCADATGTTLDPSKRWEIPLLLVGSGIQQSDVCLDIGCGSSCLPVWLDGVGCEVFAIDPEMRTVANEWSLPTSRIRVNGNFINYVRRSAADMPFANEMFDHVFCVSVIEHLPADIIRQVAGELIRVAKHGGTIGISTDVYPRESGAVQKDHAHVFNLTELRENILIYFSELNPVFAIDLTIDGGLDQHFADLKHAFNAKHSFFAAVWRKP